MSAILATVNDVLRDPRVWQGRGHHVVRTEPTGHAALDASLPGGGWPVGALTEILHDLDGTQELGLALPLDRAPDTRATARNFGRSTVSSLRAGVRRCGREDGRSACTAGLRGAGAVGHRSVSAQRHLRGSVVLAASAAGQGELRAALQLGGRKPAVRSASCFDKPGACSAKLASPAALRIAVSTDGIRVLKCRGGMARAQTIALAACGRKRKMLKPHMPRWARDSILPDLALDAIRRTGADPQAPIALTRQGSPQRRIIHCLYFSFSASRCRRARGGRRWPRRAPCCLELVAMLEDDAGAHRCAVRELLIAWAYGYSGEVSLACTRCAGAGNRRQHELVPVHGRRSSDVCALN